MPNVEFMSEEQGCMQRHSQCPTKRFVRFWNVSFREWALFDPPGCVSEQEILFERPTNERLVVLDGLVPFGHERMVLREQEEGRFLYLL